MPPATGRITFLDALLRLYRRPQRKADTGEALTAADLRAAARYRAVADAPISKAARLLAQRGAGAGSPAAIHLQRLR
jgi:hypothetical protein